MKIAIASTGQSLDDPVSDRFGRCPYFLIVDADSGAHEVIPNPGQSMPGGAGPAAVQAIVQQGAEVILAGEFGPKAQQALDTAGVRSVQVAGIARDAMRELNLA